MTNPDLEKLLSGYATGTLTDEERQALFQAALHDQTLFNTLADEQALKELLDDPHHRQRLLQSLRTSPAPTRTSWLSPILAWVKHSPNLALAGSVVVALLALTFVVKLVDDVGPIPTLEPDQNISAPSPPSKPSSVPTAEPVMRPEIPTSSKLERSSSLDVSTPSSKDFEASPPSSIVASPSRQMVREQTSLADRVTEEPVSQTKRGIAHMPPAPSAHTAPKGAADRLESRNGWKISARELFYKTMKQRAFPQTPRQVQGQAISQYAEQQRESSNAPLATAAKKPEERFETVEALEHTTGFSESSEDDLQATKEFERRSNVKAKTPSPILPLGLRYSILKQQAGQTFSEVDASTPFSSGDVLRLTVETNQSGYLYLLTSHHQEWRTLFPRSQAGNGPDVIAGMMEGRTRYIIPRTGSLNLEKGAAQTQFVILFSRHPQENLHERLASLGFHTKKVDQSRDSGETSTTPFLSRTDNTNLVTEKVSMRLSNGSIERAVYVVDIRPQQSPYVATGFSLHHP